MKMTRLWNMNQAHSEFFEKSNTNLIEHEISQMDKPEKKIVNL